MPYNYILLVSAEVAYILSLIRINAFQAAKLLIQTEKALFYYGTTEVEVLAAFFVLADKCRSVFFTVTAFLLFNEISMK